MADTAHNKASTIASRELGLELVELAQQKSPNIERVRELIGQGADLYVTPMASSWPAFFYALVHGNYDVAKELLDGGYDINHRSGYHTALHLMTSNRSKDGIHFLLTYGANPELRNSDHQTVREVADRRYNNKPSNFTATFDKIAEDARITRVTMSKPTTTISTPTFKLGGSRNQPAAFDPLKHIRTKK